MSTAIVWLLAFLVGASVSRLLTVDALFEPARERWEAHVKARIDALLDRAAMALEIRGTALDRRTKARQQILQHAMAEPGVSWLICGKMRRLARPWSGTAVRLARLESYAEFVSCPWCLPFWVFLTEGIGVWVLHFDAAGSPIAPVVFAFASRWIYGLAAQGR